MRPRFPVQPSVTLALVVVNAVAFFVNWGTGQSLVPWLDCAGDFSRPWTLLTYSVVPLGSPREFLWMFFGLWFLYGVGTSLERTSGVKGLLGVYFGYSLASAVLGSLVAKGVGLPLLLTGPWIPIAALVCLWAGQGPTQEIRLMGIVPLQARWFALLTAVALVVCYGAQSPLIGAAVAAPCLAAWFQGAGTLFAPRRRAVVSGRGQRAQSGEEFDAFMTKVKEKEREREERERLRKLLEGSVSDGTSDPGNRTDN
ncbi:MAG: hypothetical protein JST30_15000 [Armatimonadetes bacterium]|nr:hypothetical protein [Armatimonadota bacterium]